MQAATIAEAEVEIAIRAESQHATVVIAVRLIDS